MIGKAFAREVGDLIRYDAKVVRIQQDDGGVTVTYGHLSHIGVWQEGAILSARWGSI